MGLFGKKKDIDLSNVVSIVIIEQTQNYKKSKAKAGLVFGDSFLKPDVVFMEGNSEPDGCTYTFSVTFKDGSKEIMKADSGTPLCDALLQKAIDDGSAMPKHEAVQCNKPEKAPELKKNQLPQGVYKIGQDIPAGTYDFHHIWGNGRIEVYTAEETILGNLSFGEWVGDTQEYEKPDCINVKCDEGWSLHITGNVVVEIAKAKNIEIDL